MRTQNALIKRTQLGRDDHSVLAVCLDLEYGNGNTQSFGSYDVADAGCLAFITAVLRVVGVRFWEELVGRHVRIRADNGLIVSLGHYMKEDWFCPRDEWAKGGDCTQETWETMERLCIADFPQPSSGSDMLHKAVIAGTSRVFNWLKSELPPLATCQASGELLRALRQIEESCADTTIKDLKEIATAAILAAEPKP